MEQRTKGQAMENPTRIIALTGAESTGKSTLAQMLAAHLGVEYFPEFARDYIAQKKGRYQYEDVEYIAQKQIEQYQTALKLSPPYLILDTWLIITKVWFEVVFSRTPDWLEQAIRTLRIDLFLLCDTDIPWLPDNVRANGGDNRLRLQEQYRKYLNEYNFKYELISGPLPVRFQKSLQAIETLP